MTKERRNMGMVLISAIMLAVLVFLFYLFLLPYHLFMKEQVQLYLLTSDYFLSYFNKPAWLARHLGDFMTQFFYLRGGGATVLSLLLVMEWWLITKLLSRYGNKWFVPLLALFPVGAEWMMHTELTYTVAHTMSLLLVLLTAYLYTSVAHKKTVSMIVGTLSALLLYPFAGATSMLFPLLVIVFDLYKRRVRVIYWSTLVVISVAVPLLLRSYYLLTAEQSWLYPFTSIRQCLSLLVFLLCLLLLYVKPIRKMWQGVTVVLAFWGVWIVFVATGLALKTDLTQEKILALSSESYFGNWQRVDKLVNSTPVTNDIITYYTNISLAGRGEMGEKLLEYYQPMANGLFLPVGPQSGWTTIFFSGDVFFYLGDMNMAQHSAMLGMIFSPASRSSRMVKRLAEINMINSDSTATRKYLRLLDATMFHAKWARGRETMLTSVDSTAYPWLQQKRELLPERDIIRFPSDYYTSLRTLVDSNSQNTAALDYLLCYSLLRKDLKSFMADYDKYYKGKKEGVSKVYAEALLIWLASTKASEKVMKSYDIPPAIVAEFTEYTQLFEANEGTIEPLQDRFATTYWFYFHYAQMKEV